MRSPERFEIFKQQGQEVDPTLDTLAAIFPAKHAAMAQALCRQLNRGQAGRYYLNRTGPRPNNHGGH